MVILDNHTTGSPVGMDSGNNSDGNDFVVAESGEPDSILKALGMSRLVARLGDYPALPVPTRGHRSGFAK